MLHIQTNTACLTLQATTVAADLGGYLLLQNEAGARRPSSHPATEEQRREYAVLRAASCAAQAAVRAAEEETQGILASRQRQEQGTQLVATSFYDVTRLKVQRGRGVAGCSCVAAAAGG